MTIYCFDIDGTIFSTKGSDYPNSLPIQHRIDKVNELYKQGHEITLFTARGTTTGIDWRELTESQLNMKIEALLKYKSEIRDYPFPRSPEGISAFARYRGIQSGNEFAEAFRIIRSIENS